MTNALLVVELNISYADQFNTTVGLFASCNNVSCEKLDRKSGIVY